MTMQAKSSVESRRNILDDGFYIAERGCRMAQMHVIPSRFKNGPYPKGLVVKRVKGGYRNPDGVVIHRRKAL